MSPFFANYGFEPRWAGRVGDTASSIPSVVQRVQDLEEVHSLCKANIALANEEYAKYYNSNRREDSNFEEGDLVMVSMRNITTTRPSKKLDIKYSGPFKIVKKISPGAFRVELPASMKCHNVFNISSLQAFRAPTMEGQVYDPPGPVEVDDSGEIWGVKRVVSSQWYRNQLQYLVEWEGFSGTSEETSWEPAKNLEGAQESIDKYHIANPEMPSREQRTRTVKI